MNHFDWPTQAGLIYFTARLAHRFDLPIAAICDDDHVVHGFALGLYPVEES